FRAGGGAGHRVCRRFPHRRRVRRHVAPRSENHGLVARFEDILLSEWGATPAGRDRTDAYAREDSTGTGGRGKEGARQPWEEAAGSARPFLYGIDRQALR